MRNPVGVSNSWGERTAADLSSLLVELSRAQKGLSFYAGDHATSHDLLERAFLAWQGELERAGPLDLRIDASGFQATDVEETISGSHLDGLVETLLARGIHHLQFSRDMRRETFCDFVRLLTEPPAAPNAADASQSSSDLRAGKHRGIAVNGQSDPAGSPVASEFAGSSEISASLGSALLGARPPTVCPDAGEIKLSIDEHPLAAPASGDTAAELLRRLRELDWCSADSSYETLAAQAVALANQLAEEGAIDEAYRAPLVFAGHAVGEGGRSGRQAQAAQAALVELAAAGRLSEIIDRTRSSNGRRSVRAAQVLLQLGEMAAPAILERLEQEADREKAAQLAAVVLALGERAVPAVKRQMADGVGARALLAVRLAGELQNPGLVEPLRKLLRGDAIQVAKEAAKSLVHIGNSEAVGALEEALSSPKIEMARVAAFCLGVLREPRTTGPLLARLAQARKQRQIGLARDIIRSLGQFKRGGDVAIRELAVLLERRTPPWRADERQLKLEAVRALGQLPGDEALRALQGAAACRNSRLRQCAQETLARRTRDDSAGRS
jgi:HEAT repeat protein